MSINKYNTGKVYTIRCKTDDTLIYVGSTTQPLCRRLAGHKTDNKKYPNSLLYSTINNDWDNFFIELYEEYPCENKEQLNKREGEIIREIKPSLNKNMAGRCKKQYYIDNKDNFKEYYNNNKDKIKLYYLNNAERLKDYQKNYTLKNKKMIVV